MLCFAEFEIPTPVLFHPLRQRSITILHKITLHSCAPRVSPPINDETVKVKWMFEFVNMAQVSFSARVLFEMYENLPQKENYREKEVVVR
jgi:hypothetical protein